MEAENIILKYLTKDNTGKLENLKECLECSGVSCEIHKVIRNLFYRHFIKINNPPECTKRKIILSEEINIYEFALSESGKRECIKRNLLINK